MSLRSLGAQTTPRLATIHRAQIRREPWPAFAEFERERYPLKLRREAAIQWAGRARNEHGSIHQFSQVSHALCCARAPLELQGALARLLTDEVRHAELCLQMALACDPELPPERLTWEAPETPWEAPPADPTELEAWAARAILIACCLGETLSRPMLDAIALVASDPVAAAVARQILRDEHLHATFGWEALSYLVPRLSEDQRERLQKTLRGALAGFEASTTCGISIEEVAGTTLVIEPSPPESPNLGTLTPHQYAGIFYSTLEREIFPRFEILGLDPAAAWATRGKARPRAGAGDSRG